MAVVKVHNHGAVKPCRRKLGRFGTGWLLVAVTALAFTSAGFVQAQPLEGAAARGRDLFTGHVRFRNGGPACSVCHSAAGIAYPNGGTLGPNLSGLYSKLGPVGARAAFSTLYFPTMVPIYTKHPLVPEEQADLIAFFQATANQPKSPDTTGGVLGLGIAGAIIFIILTAFFWRKRVLGVRERLVRRATAELRAQR